MMSFFASYQSDFDLFLIAVGFAYSQQLVLRAGVFSIATAGFAAVGAYCVALGVTRYGMHPVMAAALASISGAALGYLLSVPLARLRGVYQAIATLAFVEIIVALNYFFADFTNGAAGINNVPRSIGTIHLVVLLAVVVYFVHAISRSGIGRAFDVIRQDETVAVSLGVSVNKYHTLAFCLSGVLGGLYGGILAMYTYSVDPAQFGFEFIVATLTAVVLGGRSSLWGPILGAAIIAALPEIARPLEEHRPLVHGVLMILIITFLPHGVADGLELYLRQRRARNRQPVEPAKSDTHDKEARRGVTIA